MEPTTASRLTDLRLVLRAQGTATARDLCGRLRFSQPTLSRLIGAAGDDILRLGRGPSTRYLLRRSIRRLGDRFPLYRTGADGVIRLLGMLEATHPDGFHLACEGPAPAWFATFAPDGLFPDLPFFLQDARPQGFLGRAIARQIPSPLSLSTDPLEWSGDDVLTYFLTEGHDLPGSLLIGDRMAQRAAAPVSPVLESSLGPALETLAAKAWEGEVTGTSAGGEQPKFATTLADASGRLRHVIVKFTGSENSPARTRWADLLACEHHALNTLRDSLGLPAASSRILDHGGRRFLIVERFDRVGARGRRGVVSLGALLDTAGPDGVDRSTDWTTVSAALDRSRLITLESARRLRLQHIFGQLISNSDMHAGNFSFFLEDSFPLEACPAYDLLPMAFAPNNQGTVPSATPTLPAPIPRFAADWAAASAAANRFWTVVSGDPQISAGFRRLARAMAAQCG